MKQKYSHFFLQGSSITNTMNIFYKTNTKGFFLVEVLVSVFVVTTVIIFVLGSVYDTVGVTKRSLERTQAAFLLEENAEVLRFLRSSSWATISGLVEGTVYGIVWNGTVWSIATGAQTEEIYTRSFVCESVSRDAVTDTIVTTGGVDDPGTKLCTITVSWQTPSGSRNETLSLYLTNITL